MSETKLEPNINKSTTNEKGYKKLLSLKFILPALLILAAIGLVLYLFVIKGDDQTEPSATNGTTANNSSHPTATPTSTSTPTPTANSSTPTATPTPSSGGNSSPTPTPASTPTPTPTPFPLFAVTAAQVTPNASCYEFDGMTFPYTHSFTYVGTITTNAPGTVNYKWIQDPPMLVPSWSSLTFSSAGTLPVTPYALELTLGNWQVDRTSGEAHLIISAPNSFTSNITTVELVNGPTNQCL